MKTLLTFLDRTIQVQDRSRSDFATDVAYRCYYEKEQVRVWHNLVLWSLALGLVAGIGVGIAICGGFSHA